MVDSSGFWLCSRHIHKHYPHNTHTKQILTTPCEVELLFPYEGRRNKDFEIKCPEAIYLVGGRAEIQAWVFWLQLLHTIIFLIHYWVLGFSSSFWHSTNPLNPVSPVEQWENEGEGNTTSPSPGPAEVKVTKKLSAFVLVSLEKISTLIFNHFFPLASPPPSY